MVFSLHVCLGKRRGALGGRRLGRGVKEENHLNPPAMFWGKHSSLTSFVGICLSVGYRPIINRPPCVSVTSLYVVTVPCGHCRGNSVLSEISFLYIQHRGRVGSCGIVYWLYCGRRQSCLKIACPGFKPRPYASHSHTHTICRLPQGFNGFQLCFDFFLFFFL